jgi:hypothetical protein
VSVTGVLETGSNVIIVEFPSTQIMDIDTPTVQVIESHSHDTTIVDVTVQSGPIESHSHETIVMVQ